MTVVVTERLSLAPLREISLELTRGRHALLGSSEETAALVDLLTGVRRPQRGTIRVAGRDPHRDPATRRRIGSLLHGEPPLVGRTVRAALTFTLGDRRAVEPTLDRLGLGSWADRDAARLSPGELRGVAWAVALATREPILVALWEPFAHTTGVSRTTALDELAALSEHCCVVCATSSVRDALALEGSVTVLSQGQVVSRQLALPGELAPGRAPDFAVRTPRARELAAALLRSPDIAGVEWDGRTAPHLLKVRGRDAETAARTIVATARAESVPVESLTAADPSWVVVQTASHAALRAAREQERRAPAPATSPGTGNLAPSAAAALAGAPPVAAPVAPPSAGGTEARDPLTNAASNLPGVASTAVALPGTISATLPHPTAAPSQPPGAAEPPSAAPAPVTTSAPPIAAPATAPSPTALPGAQSVPPPRPFPAIAPRPTPSSPPSARPQSVRPSPDDKENL